MNAKATTATTATVVPPDAAAPAAPARGHAPSRLLWPLAALALLLGFNLLFTPGFFHIVVQQGHFYGSLIDVLKQAAPSALVALGMSLVIATGGVDLSVGALVAIAGAVAARLLTEHPGAGLALAAPVALALAVALGACNGLLTAVFGVQPIVATLILMVAGRGVAQLISEGQIITVENGPFSFLSGGHLLGLPFPVTIVLGMLALTAAFTRLSAVGLFIEAVGDNEVASRYAGVRVRGIKFLVYAFSGLCAGAAGLLVASDIKAADANNAGMYLELDAILAVVLGGGALTGGRFSLLGSLVGALIIQSLVTTMLTRGVPVEYTLVVKALVVLAVCLLQSDNLRGRLRIRRQTRAAAGPGSP